MGFSRRRFCQVVATATVSAPYLNVANAKRGPRTDRNVFQHGVASGDPLADSVILWTRVTPANRDTGIVPV